MAEKAEAAAAESKEKQPRAGGGGSKVVLILMAVNSLLLAGVLAVLLLRPPGARATPAGEADEAGKDGHAAAAEGEKMEGHAEAPEEGEHGEKKGEGGDGAAGAGTAPGTGPTVRLPDFIVHLRDADSARYARVTFEVEVKEEKAKELIAGRMPQIRDSFLAYLSDRTVDELRGSEAMAQLKEALSRRLREIVPAAPVKALYVTDLVLQ